MPGREGPAQEDERHVLVVGVRRAMRRAVAAVGVRGPERGTRYGAGTIVMSPLRLGDRSWPRMAPRTRRRRASTGVSSAGVPDRGCGPRDRLSAAAAGASVSAVALRRRRRRQVDLRVFDPRHVRTRARAPKAPAPRWRARGRAARVRPAGPAARCGLGDLRHAVIGRQPEHVAVAADDPIERRQQRARACDRGAAACPAARGCRDRSRGPPGRWPRS